MRPHLPPIRPIPSLGGRGEAKHVLPIYELYAEAGQGLGGKLFANLFIIPFEFEGGDTLEFFRSLPKL